MSKLLLGFVLLFSLSILGQDIKKDSIEVKKDSLPSLESYLYKTDKFSGEKVYYGDSGTINFSKYVSSKLTGQYISIKVGGSTLNYGCYGAWILFEDGQKIIKKDIKVETGYNDGYEYSVFFIPTYNEVMLLKTKRVIAVKLYIYDEDVSIESGNDIRLMAKVILDTPKKPTAKKKK